MPCHFWLDWVPSLHPFLAPHTSFSILVVYSSLTCTFPVQKGKCLLQTQSPVMRLQAKTIAFICRSLGMLHRSLWRPVLASSPLSDACCQHSPCLSTSVGLSQPKRYSSQTPDPILTPAISRDRIRPPSPFIESETGSSSVVQPGHELTILLPQLLTVGITDRYHDIQHHILPLNRVLC